MITIHQAIAYVYSATSSTKILVTDLSSSNISDLNWFLFQSIIVEKRINSLTQAANSLLIY
jgi:hypothetical protein